MRGTGAKFTAQRREDYLGLLRQGGRRYKSARAVGVSPHCVDDYILANPEWAAQRDKAEYEADQEVEDALREAAIAGNVTACQVWLYNRRPQTWADRRQVDTRGKVVHEGKVEVEHREVEIPAELGFDDATKASVLRLVQGGSNGNAAKAG